MITREQFEAHVRAEAEKAVPVVRLKHPTLKHYSFDLSEGARKLYIAARMEHEWPLVEWLDELTRQCSTLSAQAAAEISPLTLQQCRSALSPYTTKPIES